MHFSGSHASAQVEGFQARRAKPYVGPLSLPDSNAPIAATLGHRVMRLSRPAMSLVALSCKRATHSVT